MSRSFGRTIAREKKKCDFVLEKRENCTLTYSWYHELESPFLLVGSYMNANMLYTLLFRPSFCVIIATNLYWINWLHEPQSKSTISIVIAIWFQ